MKNFFRTFIRRGSRIGGEIYPEEIFLDSSNLPAFDLSQFEGRIERPLSKRTFWGLGLAFFLVGSLFLSRAFVLQVAEGETYARQSEDNSLSRTIIFPERGIIFDRKGKELAWNEPNAEEAFSRRKYAALPGLAAPLGYVKSPARDSKGEYYQDRFVGEAGVEQAYDGDLSGANGVKIVETNALGDVVSESLVDPPRAGRNLMLSLDASLNAELYQEIASLAGRVGFGGGAGVIMDVSTGEILALTSFPEYDPNILSAGEDQSAIKKFLADPQNLFLNRATDGLYTPGSIVKPFVAAGVLDSKLIDPRKEILSTGSISIPNPYVPGAKSVFRDWKAHGWVDMRHALAVSSDVYFYAVGGGYADQKGLGIESLKRYMELFGFGQETGIEGFPESPGVIPSPMWKEEQFEDGIWRIGDTYNTSIGQYGFQATPLQAARATAAVANGGVLLTPVMLLGGEGKRTTLPLEESDLEIVREGMRLAVEEGTASGLSVPFVSVAAKTGTAEIGTRQKNYVNSWVVGFFPYEKPRYAFAVLMEKGPIQNTVGGVSVMRGVLEWMQVNTPEYFEPLPSAS